MENKKSSKENEVKSREFISFGYKIVEDLASPPPQEEIDNNIEEIGVNEYVSFVEIGSDFTTSLLFQLEYMSEIGRAAEATDLANMCSLPELINEIRNRSQKAKPEEPHITNVEFEMVTKKVDRDEEEKDTFRCKIYEYSHLERLGEYYRYYQRALKILHETAIQQMVNTYEQLLGNLVKWQLYENPDAAPKDRTITYRDLLIFSSFPEARKHVIDEVVTDFLRNKDINQQLKYIKDNFNVDIGSQFSHINTLKNFILTRHLIVHAGGIATSEYIKKLKPQDDYFSTIQVGQQLILPAQEVMRAWNIVYSFGVILLHLVCRKYAKKRKLTDLEEKADGFLNISAYSCILKKQYYAAEIILEYANGLTLSQEARQLL